MSAQIMDSIMIHNHTYNIIEVSSPSMMFRPSDFGLQPTMTCTACYRGHWCDYQIKDLYLYLKDFYMYSADNYPALNGVNILSEAGVASEKMGHKIYKNVYLRLPYTGKMIVGKDLIYEFHKNGGRQNCWAYTVMLECTFENGRIVSSDDYSSLAKAIREYIKNEGLSTTYTRYEEIPVNYWGCAKWVLNR